MESAAPVIETAGLGKSFGSHRALEDATLSVARGEVFGVLGRNGAGKTTLIRLLLGLIRPSTGSGQVFGHDCWRDRRAVHARCGVLPSEFYYDKELTGRQVIEFFARLRQIDVSTRVDELATRLDADLDRPLKVLSHGNRQKVGLTQALAHNPELIVLDEPTGGLDPLMQEEFLRIIGELRAAGHTVLISSHNMAEVEHACDRVAMIHDGRLLAVEPVETLLGRLPRQVRIVFSRPAGPAAFSALEGVQHVRAEGPVVKLELTGDADALLRAAVDAGPVTDFICERPSLEQAFVRLHEEPS